MEKGIWKEIPYHLGYFLGFFEMTLGAVFCFFAPGVLNPQCDVKGEIPLIPRNVMLEYYETEGMLPM